MKKLLLACLASGLTLSQAAQAQDAADVFKPAGGWTADYGDDYCRLIRTFSNGKDGVSLGLERTQPGLPVRLILVGNGVKVFRSAEEIGYSLLPAGTTAKARFARSETTEGNQYLSLDPVFLAPPAGFGPPDAGAAPAAPPPYDRAAEQEAARGITGLALGEGMTAPARIETGSLRAPVAALQACADDLLKVWGLDPEKHQTMTAPAVLNPKDDGVLPQGTIPFTEFAKLAGGANEVRLLIGADGKPTSCTIRSPSLSELLNDRICKLALERASFQPAKDASGQAMASYWLGSPLFLGPPFPARGRR